MSEHQADDKTVEKLEEHIVSAIGGWLNSSDGASADEIAAALGLALAKTILMIDCPDCRMNQLAAAEAALREVRGLASKQAAQQPGDIEAVANQLFASMENVIRENRAATNGAVILAALNVVAHVLVTLGADQVEDAKRDALARAELMWTIAVARAAEYDRGEIGPGKMN